MKMSKARIVVLLSTYNGETYIREQLDSIFNQEGEFTLHVKIRDDGSKDTTLSILKEYMDKGYSLEVVEGTNKGYVQSFMELLFTTEGYDYYAFSDQDDTWIKDKIDSAYQKIKEIDGPALYGSCSFLSDNDHHILGVTQKKERPITPYNGFIECFMPGHTQLLNNKLVEGLKGTYDVTRIYAHDFWITTYAINFASVVFDDKAHTYYRQHNQNVTGYSSGQWGWIKQRLARVKKGEANKRSAQIHYFKEFYYDDLEDGIRNEMDLFYEMNTSVWSRLRYVMKTKLYYQSKKKTLFYKLLYIKGGYKVEGVE